MDSHQSFDENWARSSDMVNLLAYMLAFPLADHSTAVKQVLLGGLRAAQLHSLTRKRQSQDAGWARSTALAAYRFRSVCCCFFPTRGFGPGTRSWQVIAASIRTA
jgi:hypothetical protein